MSAHRASKNPAVLSYYAMRKAVGLIALSLPVVLAVGRIAMARYGPDGALPHPLLERSISDYYYTPMRNYLVGSLCAIAAFLACSRGYEMIDEIMGYVAGAFTFGVALVPSVNPRGERYTHFQIEVGFIHTGFAALMFLVLAYFCFFLFRRSSPDQPFTRRKRHRNRVYGVCGLTMLVSMLEMVSLTLDGVQHRHPPSGLLFWWETLALVAFGVAWLTKGEGILKDKLQNHHNHHGQNSLNHSAESKSVVRQ